MKRGAEAAAELQSQVDAAAQKLQDTTAMIRKLQGEAAEAVAREAGLHAAAAAREVELHAASAQVRQENAALRREFRGFVDSIEWWKHELTEPEEKN